MIKRMEERRDTRDIVMAGVEMQRHEYETSHFMNYSQLQNFN